MSERMRELVDRLNETAYAYYVLNNPIISDAQWDALYDELLALEAQTGQRLADSPTLRVGGEPLSAFAPHTHLGRLWSLDKTTTTQGLAEWAARAEKLRAASGGLAPLAYMVEYKLDGLSVNLTYEGGQLVQAATRGNGTVGEAILPQVRTIQSIPLSIPHPGRMEVQGEALMRLSTLEKYNATAQEPLKNARNAAAGALRNLDPKITAARRLDVYCYQVGYIEGRAFSSHAEMLDFLRENRFPVTPLAAPAQTLEEAMDIVRQAEAKREQLDFLIDGAVIKVNDYPTRTALGYTDKFPRWAIAFKFKAEEAVTRLNDVSWELGRTGKLTPLAHLEAVDLGGVTVQRATLNNVGDIQKKQVRIGASVWVRRSGDVIPEIMGRTDEILPDERDVVPPETCPACGATLAERGAHLFCENPDCRPQRIAQLAHFSSRSGMDIEGFSERTALLLYDEVGLRDADGLYALDPDALVSLPGMGEKKVQNLLAALEKSKTRPLPAFLYALGIPNVGVKTARDLAQRYGSLEAVMEAEEASLLDIDEVGDVVAASVADFFRDDARRAMVRRLLERGVRPEMPAPIAPQSGGMADEVVVVTGTLESLSRKEAEAAVLKAGGQVGSSVTQKTTLLVAGESAGSKLDKAKTLGIPIVDEAAFLKRLEIV